MANTQHLWDRPGPRALLERLAAPLLKRIAPTAKFPADMVLPKLAPRHLRDRYPELTQPNPAAAGPRVAYFHGCAANYFDDGVGDAVIGVLRKHKVNPELPPQRCSGTPIETYGHVDLVKDNARFNLQSLAGYDQVVTGCASCTLMLKEYKKFFEAEPERQAADALAKKVVHITEFVARSAEHPPMGAVEGPARRVTYHSSCHLRAAGVTKEPRQLLQQVPGADYVEMTDADRCAGIRPNFNNRINLASFYLGSEKWQMAENIYNSLIKDSQNLSEQAIGLKKWQLLYGRSNALIGQKKHKEAIKDLREAISLEPRNPTLLNALGYILADNNQDLNEALELLEEAVARRPKSGETIDSLGWVLFRLGRYEEALDRLEDAIVYAPNVGEIAEHLGDAYWFTNRYEEARLEWKKAYNLHTNKLDKDRVKTNMTNRIPKVQIPAKIATTNN